ESQALTQTFGDKWDTWYVSRPEDEGVKLSELPLPKLRKAVVMSKGGIDDQLSHAVTRRDCDWQLGVDQLTGGEIVSFLLPEINNSRHLSRFLGMRARRAIAEGRNDDAIEAIHMSYRMASDMAKQNLLVSRLVGIAEVQLAND